MSWVNICVLFAETCVCVCVKGGISIEEIFEIFIFIDVRLVIDIGILVKYYWLCGDRRLIYMPKITNLILIIEIYKLRKACAFLSLKNKCCQAAIVVNK